MPDLPRTDIDSFFRYEWQMSSAVRPEWKKRPLFREAYFGRTCLAEPVHGEAEGPPYVVCTYPYNEGGLRLWVRTQDEITLAFSKEEAEKAVKRHDKRTLEEEAEPSLFEKAQ